jgi:hypothetical protein
LTIWAGFALGAFKASTLPAARHHNTDEEITMSLPTVSQAIVVLQDAGVCPIELRQCFLAIYNFARDLQVHVTEGVAVSAALTALGFNVDDDLDVFQVGFTILHTTPDDLAEAMGVAVETLT